SRSDDLAPQPHSRRRGLSVGAVAQRTARSQSRHRALPEGVRQADGAVAMPTPAGPLHDGHPDVRRMCSRRTVARFGTAPLRRDSPLRRRLSERPAVTSSAALPSGTAAAPPSRSPAPRSLAPDIARGLMLVLIAVANVSWFLWGHEGAVGMTPHVPALGPA